MSDNGFVAYKIMVATMRMKAAWLKTRSRWLHGYNIRWNCTSLTNPREISVISVHVVSRVSCTYYEYVVYVYNIVYTFLLYNIVICIN